MPKENKIILGIVNDVGGYNIYMYKNKVKKEYLIDTFRVDKILLSLETVKEIKEIKL